ncbi:MAG: DUF4199 domain-containing protein [Paludibacteraceae bacterium]|nr:DUF4199 domain-containing protein [Paludibacteraceae bacterium]
MENDNRISNPFPHAMRWGLLIGACFGLNFLLSTSTSTVTAAISWLIEAFILVATWRIGKNYRDTEAGGSLSFYRAFSYIFILYFFAGLIGALVKLLYTQYVNPGYLDGLMEQTLQVLQQLKIDLPEDSAGQLRQLMTPVQFTMQSFMADTLLGALLGLLYAPFLRKTEKNDHNEHLDSSASV